MRFELLFFTTLSVLVIIAIRGWLAYNTPFGPASYLGVRARIRTNNFLTETVSFRICFVVL